MPSRTALSTPLRAWRCPQCRAFATTPRRQALGPEHPRYIEVPEPPQQDAPYLPFIKGRLPVPRNVFHGLKRTDKANDEEIAKAAAPPRSRFEHPKGSREEWRQKMSDSRRQNLRDGLKTLRTRSNTRDRRRIEQTERKKAEHEALIRMPERDDERFTAPSHGLDLEKLLHGTPPDPNREARLQRKREKVDAHAAQKKAERMDHMHTLYMRARDFIVTPEQLDQAVEKAFGTTEDPVKFTGDAEGTSMWVRGAPDSLQNMLDRANRIGRRTMLGSADGSVSGVQSERMRRLVESLTGGKLDARE